MCPRATLTMFRGSGSSEHGGGPPSVAASDVDRLGEGGRGRSPMHPPPQPSKPYFRGLEGWEF